MTVCCSSGFFSLLSSYFTCFNDNPVVSRMQQVVLYIYHYFSVGDSGLKAWTPHFIQQMSFDAPPTGIPQRVRAVV